MRRPKETLHIVKCEAISFGSGNPKEIHLLGKALPYQK